MVLTLMPDDKKTKFHNCTNCECFCWWDGDFCCTWKMKILWPADSTGRYYNHPSKAFNAITDRKDFKPSGETFYGTDYQKYLELERLKAELAAHVDWK